MIVNEVERLRQKAHYDEIGRRTGRITAPATVDISRPVKEYFKWTPDRIATLRSMWEAGDKIESIALQLECKPATVASKRAKLGLPLRHSVAVGKQLTEDQKAEFRRLWESGRSIKNIAKKLGITPQQAKVKRISLKLAKRKLRNDGATEKIILYLSKAEKRQISNRAWARGISISYYLEKLITKALRADDAAP